MNIEINKDILEAYYWLCSLEVDSEAEAVNKEIILSMLDDYKFNEYFKNQKTLESWGIKNGEKETKR